MLGLLLVVWESPLGIPRSFLGLFLGPVMLCVFSLLGRAVSCSFGATLNGGEDVKIGWPMGMRLSDILEFLANPGGGKSVLKFFRAGTMPNMVISCLGSPCAATGRLGKVLV